MKKELKEKFIGKHECKKDLFRDIAACLIVVYVAVLAFLLVDSKVQLVNAQTDLIGNQIAVCQQNNMHMMK